MKPAAIHLLAVAWSILAFAFSDSSISAQSQTRYVPLKGKIRMEGTSNIDAWQVESKSISGFLELGAGFPAQVNQKAAPGTVDARMEASVEVRSLKSIEKDGKPYSNKMDEIMYDALRARENPRLDVRLTRLVLTQPAKVSSSPNELEAHVRLTAGGVSKDALLPLKVLTLSGNQIRIWGTAALKMTDFRIDPPSPTIALGLIKTGDEVKVSFECTLGPQ